MPSSWWTGFFTMKFLMLPLLTRGKRLELAGQTIIFSTMVVNLTKTIQLTAAAVHCGYPLT
jgi:hypothetical protein